MFIHLLLTYYSQLEVSPYYNKKNYILKRMTPKNTNLLFNNIYIQINIVDSVSALPFKPLKNGYVNQLPHLNLSILYGTKSIILF